MTPRAAAILSFGAVSAAQIVGGTRRPPPDQPRTAAWYARLRKPGFTPPGPVFGIAWTLLDALSGFAGIVCSAHGTAGSARLPLAAGRSPFSA